MVTPKKEHEIVLLPEDPENKSVQTPWIWIILLVIGGTLVFWQNASFDENSIRKQRTEMEQRLKLEEKRLYDEPSQLKPRTGQSKGK